MSFMKQQLFYKEIGKDGRDHIKNKHSRKHTKELTTVTVRGAVYNVGKALIYSLPKSLWIVNVIDHDGFLTWPFSSNLGDFVHLKNDRDPTKPIIALIYTLWEDEKYGVLFLDR